MKRKHEEANESDASGDGATQAATTASSERDAKKGAAAVHSIAVSYTVMRVKAPEGQTQLVAAVSGSVKKSVIELDETIDVEAFFKQDCDSAAQKLIEQTKARCADLRREFAQSKQTILKELLAEKENRLNTQEDEAAAPTPDAFDVNIKCVAGPYKGHTYALHLDMQKHRTCLIGRSTGRKFRAPNGLSMPKDAELSTTHAQLRLEPDGRVFFTDLDSTNGSFINDESVEPHEPQLLSTTTPSKVYVGGSDLLLCFTRRP